MPKKTTLIAGFAGQDGTPRKLLGVSRLCELGWTAAATPRDGLAKIYDGSVAQGPGAGAGARP